MTSRFWIDDIHYQALRRRLPRDPSPTPVVAEPPLAGRPFAYSRRRAILEWAATHDGLIDVNEAADVMGIMVHTLRAAVTKMGGERVGPRTYRAPLVVAPMTSKRGRLMLALCEQAATQDGLIDTGEEAERLGVSEGAVRGALRRLEAVKTETPRVYRVPAAAP